MGILFYQIGIFIAIQVATLFGRKSRNTAIVLIGIFTLLQVHTGELMVLQFFTIILSYWFSENKILGNADWSSFQESQTSSFSEGFQQRQGERYYTSEAEYLRDTYFKKSQEEFNFRYSGYGILDDRPVLLKSEDSMFNYLYNITRLEQGISFELADDNWQKPPAVCYNLLYHNKLLMSIYIICNSNVDDTTLPDGFDLLLDNMKKEN